MNKILLPVLVMLAFGNLPASRADEKVDVEFFEKRIRPVLVEQCYSCHGPTKQKGGLRVDSRVALLRGGDSGPALVPGKPDDSRLIKAVRRLDKEGAMPPTKALPAAAVADLAAWVKTGAVFPPSTAVPVATKHWAFTPVSNPAVPRGATHPIDAFLDAKRGSSEGPQAPASDKRTLLRRATYDLTGLPPTPEEVEAFVADRSAEAFDKVLKRLLDSPAYGERWGRHWLDVVRYADTAGETADYPAPHAWRYRNYVIDSFNRDKPYDQFVREQIAGDILAATAPAERYGELITATGYLAIARRFGFDSDADMYLTHEDLIDTVGKSILGLTISCARCHNHKYDPITARDYYALYGIFASTRFSFPGSEKQQRPRDLVPLLRPAEREARSKPWRDEMARFDAELKRHDDQLGVQRKKLDTTVTTALGAGELAPNGAQKFTAGKADMPATWIKVKAGEMIRLTVLPRANFGGDSTQVELEILEQGGEKRVWNITRDVFANLDKGEVGAQQPDTFGNKKVWHFLDLVPGPTLLAEFVRDADKTAGLHVWNGGAPWPAAFVNARRETMKYQTVTLPPRVFGLHPGPKGPVAVAWQSPLTGAVLVRGKVTKLDPGGDGVAWKLDLHAGIGAGLSEQATLLAARREVQRKREALALTAPTVEVAYAVMEGTPADAKLHKRGDPNDLGDGVPRRNLDLLGGQPLTDVKSSGRLDLARWLTDARNPLTARVMVNRIWQGHFGRGLVATPNDFGTRGSPPTHPELLDHLATKFIENGWSIKALHRLIMTSAAYQRSGDGQPVAPGDYSRFPRRRLAAEEIRDTILVHSGDLDRTPGGPHPFPSEKTWSFTQHGPFKAVYETNRRSVYLMTQRIQRHPFLALFDGPDTNASTARRETSTVPTQALYFLNDPFFHARAEGLAKRLLQQPEGERVALAHRWCYQRPPTERERLRAVDFLTKYRETLTDVPIQERDSVLWSAFARTLLASNELLHVD